MNFESLIQRRSKLINSINTRKDKMKNLWDRYRDEKDDKEKFNLKQRIDSMQHEIDTASKEIHEIDSVIYPDDTIQTPTRIEKSNYDILSLNVEWGREYDKGYYPSAMKIASLLFNIQKSYDLILDAGKLPINHLEVSYIKHPNASFNFKGLGEPIDALKSLLKDIPDLVVGLWTLPAQIKRKKTKIESETLEFEIEAEKLKIIRDYAKYYWKLDESKRQSYLTEYIRGIRHDHDFPSPDIYVKVLEEVRGLQQDSRSSASGKRGNTTGGSNTSSE